MNVTTSQHRSITFCINELDIGGAERAMVRIASGLKQRDWDVRVISLRDRGPLAAQLQAAEIPVRSLNCGGFADIRAFGRLRRELRTAPTDVLYCFLHQASIYGRLAARFSKADVVVSGVRVADRRFPVVLTERLTRCCVDHYIAVSPSVAKTHGKFCHIPASKMTAIANGVDIPGGLRQTTVNDGIESRPGVADVSNTTAASDVVQANEQVSGFNSPTQNRFRLLFVGRLVEQKDPLCLLEAFRLLPAEIRAATELTFVGDGPLAADIHRGIRQYHLDGHVHLAGHRDDVSDLMRQATLLVLPSRWEGLPNVILEAMANSLPVVATAVDGISDVISNENTGWLVPPGSPQQLAAAIQVALQQSSQRQQVAIAAKSLVAKDFSWDCVIEKHDALLRSLCRRQR